MSQSAYKVNELINQYNANPTMFNDDQLDELEKLAQANQIDFKRREDPFSLTRAIGQGTAGFVEGFTTFDLSNKQPRNTGEAIFRQLGHLAGFAPSILKAPVVGLAKVTAKVLGRETKDVLADKYVSATMKAIDFMGNKSIPMIVQHKTTKVFNEKIAKAGLDSWDFMQKGAKTRAIAEEALGLGTASAVSNIWKGTDGILDGFVGGAIAGGAFGGIGNFVSVGNLYKGTPQQVETANKLLRAGTASLFMGLPATLRNDPTEMQIYEYLLGGFFGYNTRPAHEKAVGEWLTSTRRVSRRQGQLENLDPTRSKSFQKLSKEAQDYLLYDHPMSKESKEFANSRGWGGTTGQSLGFLEKVKPEVNWVQKAIESTKQPYINNKVKRAIGREAVNEWSLANIDNFIIKTNAKGLKNLQKLDFMDPNELQLINLNSVSKKLTDSINNKDLFPNRLATGKAIQTARDLSLADGKWQPNKFISELRKKVGDKAVNKNEEALRNWYKNDREPVNEVYIVELSGKNRDTVLIRPSKEELIGSEGIKTGEKYFPNALDRLGFGKFNMLTHVLDKGGKNPELIGTARKILNNYPNYQDKVIEFAINKGTVLENLHNELYSQGKYIFSGVKDKSTLVIADLVNTGKFGKPIGVEEIFKPMSRNNPNTYNDLMDAFKISEAQTPTSKAMHHDMFVSNILHHAKKNGLISDLNDLSGLSKMLTGGYLKNVADYNKRMTLLTNRMTPLDPKDYGRDKINWILVNDKDFLFKNGKKIKEMSGESNMDGMIVYRQKFFDQMIQGVGLPKGAGHLKPVMIGLGAGGLLATKSNGQRASGAIEQYLSKNNIDAMVFGSGAKLTGEYQPSKLEYNNGKYTWAESEVFKHEFPIKDIQVSSGTYENPRKAVSGTEWAMQSWNQASGEIKGFSEAFSSVVKQSLAGTKEGIKLTTDFPQDPKKIKEFLVDKELSELPFDFVMEKVFSGKSNSKQDKEIAGIFLDKINKLNAEGKLDSDIKLDIDTDYTVYNDMIDNVKIANEGNFYTKFGVLKDQQLNSLKKFIIKRYSNPFTKSAGKSWLKGITLDMQEAMFNTKGLTDPKKKNKYIEKGELYLDESFREMEFKVSDKLKAILPDALVSGDKRLTLGKVWEHYVGTAETLSKHHMSLYNDAFSMVTVRTPSDSISGTRVLRFRGFTGQRGAGSYTHAKEDAYHGGADKDSDSIKIFQGIPKAIRNAYKKYENNKRHTIPNDYYYEGSKAHKAFNREYVDRLNKDFESASIDAQEYTRITGKRREGKATDNERLIAKALTFSPHYRVKVAQRANAGLNGLGNGLSTKADLQHVVDFLKRSVNKEIVNENTGEIHNYKIEHPLGNFYIALKTDKVKGVDRQTYFNDLASLIVNKSADASSDPTVKNYSHFRDMLMNSIFKVTNKNGKELPYRDFREILKADPKLNSLFIATQQMKPNNQAQRVNSNWIKSQLEKGMIKVEGNDLKVHKDIDISLGLHGQGMRGNTSVKDGKYKWLGDFSLRRSIGKPRSDWVTYSRAKTVNTPTLFDLIAETKYVNKQHMATRKLYNSYTLDGIHTMSRDALSSETGALSRFKESYPPFIKKYLGLEYSDVISGGFKSTLDKLDDAGRVSFRKKLDNHMKALFDTSAIMTNNQMMNLHKEHKSFALDKQGAMYGQLAGIELLNKRYVNLLNSFANKGRPNVRLDNLTSKNKTNLWGMAVEVKKLAKKGFVNKEAVENLMRDHAKRIRDFSIRHKASEDLMLKYYHTMLLTPQDGFATKRKFEHKAGKEIDFYEADYYLAIHGSNEIPMQTRREFYKGVEDFYVKMDKEVDPLNIKKPKYEAPPIEPVKVLPKPVKINEIVNKIEGVDTKKFENFAINDTQQKSLNEFTKNLNDHPYIRDNFKDWFTSFTYENAMPKTVDRINLLDIVAINQYFKRSKNPLDLEFHNKHWLNDPRYIDQELALKGMVKKYKVATAPVKGADGKRTNQPIYQFMSPIGEISRFTLQSDRGVAVEKNKLLARNKELNKFLSTLGTEKATRLTEQLFELRDNPRSNLVPTAELSKYNKLVTDFNKRMAEKYVWTYDSKGERISNAEGRWTMDKNFNGWFLKTKGKLNDYMHWNKDGTFNFKRFRKKVIDKDITNEQLIREVGIDGLQRYLYEQRLADWMRVTELNPKVNIFTLRAGEKSGYQGVGDRGVNYLPRMNFGYNEKAQAEFIKSVKEQGNRIYLEHIKKTNDSKKQKKIAKEKAERYVKFLESKAQFNTEFIDIKNIADYGNISEATLNKGFEIMDLGKKEGILRAREANLKGYDKRPTIFNEYADKMIDGWYKNLVTIKGLHEIRSMKNYMRERGYKTSAKEKERFKKSDRYNNYVDVWADYLKLHMQSILGHQSFFPEEIMREVNKGIDPLHLKNSRNLFYRTSDQNMVELYEKVWQSKRLSKVPFVKNIVNNAPIDPEARKEYFSRKLHSFGRMEAQYELMTLLANSGTWATNLFSGASMTVGSAGLRNFVNSFKNNVVKPTLLQNEKGQYTLKLSSGKTVNNRKRLMEWLEERGVIDNFILNEFEYNDKLVNSLKKLKVDLGGLKRDLRKAINNPVGRREESVLDVVKRYGVKDVMVKYGSFFMQHSERVNRLNAFIAHGLQAVNRFGVEGKELTIADQYVFDKAMKGIENTQFLYQNSQRPAFMRTATGKVLFRFKLFAWNSIKTRRDFYKQAKLYGFKQGTQEYERAKDLFLTDMFMMALGSAFMFSVFDTSLAPPYDWIQTLADYMYGDKHERDMAFHGSKLGPLALAKPPIARIPEAMWELASGNTEEFAGYTAYTLFPFGRTARQLKQLTERPDRAGEILLRIPVNDVNSKIEKAKQRGELQDQLDMAEDML